MKRAMLDHILNLTQSCLERLWQKDCELLLSLCSSSIIYIGPVEEECCHGLQSFEETCRKITDEILPSHLVNAEYFIASNSADSCVVVVRYLSTTDAETDAYLQFPQRASFVWAKTSKGLEIRHIHISNPLNEIKVIRGELFPNEMGRLSRRYMERRVSTLLSRQRFVVRDKHGCAHFLSVMEVVFIEADGKRSIVHTIDGVIGTTESYGELVARLPQGFCSVHRSYTVNIDHIRRIGSGKLWLLGDVVLPIPRRNFRAIRQKLSDHYRLDGREIGGVASSELLM